MIFFPECTLIHLHQFNPHKPTTSYFNLFFLQKELWDSVGMYKSTPICIRKKSSAKSIKINFKKEKSTLENQVQRTFSTNVFTRVVMSKTKGQPFQYCFGNETKTFWYPSRICLVENRLFPFGPESVLLDQIEMCSYNPQIRKQTQTLWFHSC